MIYNHIKRGNYANVVTQDYRRSLIPLQLSQIEDLIAGQFGNDYAGNYSSIAKQKKTLRSRNLEVPFIFIRNKMIILSTEGGSTIPQAL